MRQIFKRAYEAVLEADDPQLALRDTLKGILIDEVFTREDVIASLGDFIDYLEDSDAEGQSVNLMNAGIALIEGYSHPKFSLEAYGTSETDLEAADLREAELVAAVG